MNGFLIGFIVSAIVFAVVGFFLYNRNKSQLHGSNMNIESSGGDDVYIWLQNTLASFKKKYIGYLIEQLRLKNHFTYEQLKELQLEYGEIIVVPSLMLYGQFEDKFSNWDMLEQAEKKWLSQKNINFAGVFRLHDKIEDVLIAKAKIEAPKIFAEFCEKKGLNVTVFE